MHGPSMPGFVRRGFTFQIDREGVAIDEPEEIVVDVGYDDLEMDEASAPEELGKRLSELAGEKVSDDEGIFDLAVYKDGELVAALVLACEDGALSLGGERSADVEEEELAAAIVEALTDTSE
ncbi:MAG: hypothetical protein IPM79_03705 [Polyangiaceae bacterium]|nr:hypothetical protein [Polyangiaceae bacterium]